MASPNFAGNGDNTPLTGVDFTSGAINFRRGLIYYDAVLFVAEPQSEIKITSIDYNEATNQITITFESELDKTYSIARSTDLVGFEGVLNGIPTGGTETVSPPIPATAPEAFFRVSEE